MDVGDGVAHLEGVGGMIIGQLGRKMLTGDGLLYHLNLMGPGSVPQPHISLPVINAIGIGPYILESRLAGALSPCTHR